MCGFLGEFGDRITEDRRDELLRLLYLSKSRGPDETQVYTNNADLWLGFNRLAILDTSAAGSQPMHSHSGRYTLVFNGEVYNHVELRNKLQFRYWRGHSDTETVLECIEEWGFERTLDRLDGMFALAVHDRAENLLLCARDFAGIKPFFYGYDGHTFVFASQYDQITRHPSFRDNAIDKQVLRLYLEQHFMPAPFGLIMQTGQLEPGQWCTVSDSRLKMGYFWQFPEYVEPSVLDERTAQEMIGSELSASVSAEMLSDVPLGAFLSGGIDSPLVCHYAAKNSNHLLKTFTIGSDSTVHDEAHLAQEYADLIGTRHHCSKMSADSALEMFDDAMKCVREPMADFSIIPTFLVSKLARKDVTVALSGDGGDELFFGYERFWSIAKNIKYQSFPWILKAMVYKTDKLLAKNRNINSVVLAPSQAAAHRSLHSRFSKDLIERIFPDLKGTPTPKTYNSYAYRSTGNDKELIQSMRKAEFYGMMQKTLRKVDLASMGVSLEVRVPFLKKSFIETALMVDPMLSYGPNRKKLLLKAHLSNLYPQAPIDNVKRGFAVPLGKWLCSGSFKGRVTEALVGDEFIGRLGGNASALEELITAHGPHKDMKWPIFTMLALQRQSLSAVPAGPTVKESDLQISSL